MIHSNPLRPLSAAACLLALTACVPPRVAGYMSTHPTFQPAKGQTSQIGPDLNGYSQATVPKSGLIVVEGDDVVYGAEALRRKGATTASKAQSKNAFPAVLQKLLGVQVENRGIPGGTVAEGEKRWAGAPAGNLLILAYGYADAKAKTPVDKFMASLDRIVAAAHAQGAAVILLIPQAYADAKLSGDANAYRAAMQGAQARYRAGLIELNPILAPTNPHPTDGSYQTDKGYEAIAYTVAPYVAVAPDAP